MTDDETWATEPISALIERNNAKPLPRTSPAAAKKTPHSLLKKRCRDALAAFSGATGVLIPVQNVKVTIGGKTFITGRTGAGDDFWLYRGTAFSLEYKAGHDRQRDSQAVFERRWADAGGYYLIVRDPGDMINAIKRILSILGR